MRDDNRGADAVEKSRPAVAVIGFRGSNILLELDLRGVEGIEGRVFVGDARAGPLSVQFSLWPEVEELHGGEIFLDILHRWNCLR